MSAPFDQSAWIREHHLEGQKADQVFAYAKVWHPYMGTALPLRQLQEPSLVANVLKMDLANMAKYADVVTVACIDEVYQDPDNILSKEKLFLNVTSLGNVAYVALHHSDPIKRQKSVKLVEHLQSQLADAKVDSKTGCFTL